MPGGLHLCKHKQQRLSALFDCSAFQLGAVCQANGGVVSDAQGGGGLRVAQTYI